jgi:hypothetical protein
MSDFLVSVFAPVKGLRVYRHPGMIPIPEENYGLSQSEIVLGRSSSLIVIKRLTSSEGQHGLRLSVHKQVFEHGMTRDGHSFGVAIDLFDAIPESDSLLTVIGGILFLMERSCVKSNQFCTQSEFEDFLKSKLDASVARAIRDIRFLERKLLPDLTYRRSGSATFSYQMPDDVFDIKSLPIIDRCLIDPISMLFKKIYLYREGHSELGDSHSIQPLLFSAEGSSQAVCLLVEEYEAQRKNTSILNEKVNSLAAEIKLQGQSNGNDVSNPSSDILLSQIKRAVREEVKSAMLHSSRAGSGPLTQTIDKLTIRDFFRSRYWFALISAIGVGSVAMVIYFLFYWYG